ncbi:hypothetical protein BDA99DRAFT_530612 [Phascolomyces articulosus]|uniref:Uncharacterized protein n=1 Tax=Phascolomyces articulosus TaxID=60185 RepID=A0AAD5P6N1_9FUNG|nr:hypothetical protein BDA99DRAFT_530612 [Phascolomyces articulosus]
MACGNKNTSDSSAMMTDDLSSRLNSFSFSTPEEQLIKQLDSSTRINSVFQSTRHHQPESNAPVNTTEWETPLRKVEETEDGWGDLPPAYTAISQNSMFGFNSIMEADISSSSPATAKPKQSVNPNSGFGRFHNAPVSFTSMPTSTETTTKNQSVNPNNKMSIGNNSDDGSK